MILQGNQRGGARELALHLMKPENDHVDVHELRGFVANNLQSAFSEVYAVSKATKARQFLFSLSMNPPLQEIVPTSVFLDAIPKIEERLGLTGQPRAIVFHEKKGRRHAHVVWSRVKIPQMKAIPLPFTKRKLMDISRELYLENGWKMPAGFLDARNRDPLNFSLAQWQQAKRRREDPKKIKAALQDCWAISDTQASLSNALKEQGYVLAKGDRRAIVVVDFKGEVYALSKWVGLKSKEVRQRVPAPQNLPSVDQTRKTYAQEMSEHLAKLGREEQSILSERLIAVETLKDNLVKDQRQERSRLESEQAKRALKEQKERHARLSSGLRGLLDRLTGRHQKILHENELDHFQCIKRDQVERDELIFGQLSTANAIQARLDRLQGYTYARSDKLSEDLQQFRELEKLTRSKFELPSTRTKRNHSAPNRER